MNPADKVRVGDLLIQEGLITTEQLDRALLVQRNQKTYKPLGEVCVDLKFLSRTQLNRILNKHKKSIRIGDLLINLGLITPAQLDTALKHQKMEGGKIGESLVKLGFVTETSLLNTLTIQMGVPKIAPDFHLIDRTLLEGINEEFLLKHEVLPAFKEGDVLTVIMGNPLDEQTVLELSNVFKCKIEPAIALSEDIKHAVRQHYRKVTLGSQGVSEEDSKDLVIGDTNFSREGGDNIVGILDYIITNGIMERASDIHLEPKEKCLRVRYRVDGVLRHKTDLPISLAASLVSRIKVLSALDIAEKRRHQDGRIEARVMDIEVDLRVSVYASAYGESIVIRILRRVGELIELDALGMSPANRAIFQRMLDQPSGIILVTGPTGSGKTTALYAALNYLNDGEISIITVEDPIEYTMDGVVQGQLDARLGLTYVDFLKSMMRQDPDVIMVGEIRDSTAAEAVIQAALTGHKVLSTFHTDDTTGALLRLMDMGIDTFLISSTVVSIVAQRLVRKLCPQCRKPSVPDQNLLASFGVAPTGVDKLRFWKPIGCSRCGDTGFAGRTAVHEILIVTDAIRDAILARKTSSQIRLVARDKARLVSMREDGFYKATQGITSLEEVIRVVFQSEGDVMSDRSPEEIVASCEMLPGLIPKQPDSASIGGKTSLQKSEDSVSITDSNVSVLEGEVYRIRFDVTTIESEADQISDFFKAYQRIMEELGNPLDSDSLGEFADFIIYTVKRLEVSLKSEFVEFYVRVKEGKARIYVESLIPQKPSSSTLHTTQETGLRLIHYLMPSSGMEKALRTESSLEKRRGRYRRTASLIGFLEQEKSRQHKRGGGEYNEASSSRPQPGEEPRIRDALYAKSSVLYKKHVEELELSAYLKK